jgi:RHS repeat-associated protein
MPLGGTVSDNRHAHLSRLHRYASLRDSVRLLASALVALLIAIGVLAVSAVACEGTGGPPSSPPEEELGGSGGNPGAPKLKKIECGDPVNCATGDETQQQTDISIGGRGPGLKVARSYDALEAAAAKTSGSWGFGWTGPYDASLEVGAETATVREENGSAVIFYKSGTEYTQGGWDEARLTKSGTSYIYTLPEQSQLEFNSEGKLVKETERNGNSNTLAYNKSGQLETVTDGDGRTLLFAYNKAGQVESVSDPMKHVIDYTYESENLRTVLIEGKVRWEFEYESPHLLKKITDGRKHSTTFEYNGSHQVVKEVQAGHERKWKYGTKETTVTEPNGAETLEQFNTAEEPTKVVSAKGTGIETTTEYEYNGTTYNLTKMIDPNKHVWEYGYDAEGNKTSEIDPNKDDRKWEYDKKHDVTKETTPEGEATTIKRNAAGEPEVIERPINGKTQETKYAYNAKGDLTEETDPLGDITTFKYDGAGDKEEETDPEKNERKWEYNKDSQIVEETSPRKFVTKTERDERGLPTRVTDPLKHVTEYTYDGDGNVETETDPKKNVTKYEYNEENLPTKVEEPNKTIVETGYDSEGKMTSHTDGNKHKWEYIRNKLEQVTEETNPLKHVTKKTYEKAGNLETVEDPEKNTTTYKYDESNRLKSISYSTKEPSEVTFEYNKDGKVKQMTDETGTTKNSYDKLDRLTEYESGAKKAVKYEYNLDNEPMSITYPNGKAITREYDKDARLSKVTDWNKNETGFKYNSDSQLEKTTFPSASKDEDTYSYNEADQMTEVAMLHEGKPELGTLTYTRGPDGEVEKTVTTGLTGAETSEEKYDENSRLTEAHKLAYKYDAANNPQTIEGDAGYTYNEADELEKGPEDTYAYNKDGQRTETVPSKGVTTTTYGYDQAGNLTSVKRPEETPITKIEDSYTYNGNNLRQTQDINGTTANLTWDTAESLSLILNDETNNYVYGPENIPVEQIPESGETQDLHHDQQGSTRLLTKENGEKETAYTLNPYGSTKASTSKGGAKTPLLYDGQYTSIDSGLIYLRARTYDPQTAQFLTVDPTLEATEEPYSYAKDDPADRTDPAGLCQQPIPPIAIPPIVWSVACSVLKAKENAALKKAAFYKNSAAKVAKTLANIEAKAAKSGKPGAFEKEIGLYTALKIAQEGKANEANLDAQIAAAEYEELGCP